MINGIRRIALAALVAAPLSAAIAAEDTLAVENGTLHYSNGHWDANESLAVATAHIVAVRTSSRHSTHNVAVHLTNGKTLSATVGSKADQAALAEDIIALTK